MSNVLMSSGYSSRRWDSRRASTRLWRRPWAINFSKMWYESPKKSSRKQRTTLRRPKRFLKPWIVPTKSLTNANPNTIRVITRWKTQRGHSWRLIVKEQCQGTKFLNWNMPGNFYHVKLHVPMRTKCALKTAPLILYASTYNLALSFLSSIECVKPW